MKVAFTIGAETANARAVTIQLQKDTFIARNLGKARVLHAYLSSDAAGLAPVNPVTVDVVPTVGTAGELLDHAIVTTQPGFSMVTDATGKIDLVLTNASNTVVTAYLNIEDPATGNLKTSGPISFT